MKSILLAACKGLTVPLASIEQALEVPKDPTHGDYALPCFPLAKEMKRSPVEIAKDIAAQLANNKAFERVEAVGPYVNFFLKKTDIAQNVLAQVKKQKDRYGSQPKTKETVMIEFSQPNTHKAFHVGHIRGTSFGESLARIFEFSGKKVIRANYSGDAGMHIAKWIWCYKKFHAKEKPRNDEKWFASIYAEGVKKLIDNEEGELEVQRINKELDARSNPALQKLWAGTRKLSIDSWKPIYKDLDARFDVQFFESEMEEEGKKIAGELVKREIAKVSEGAVIMDLKEYGLSVWVLLRKDGSVLYSAKDLALAEKKERDFKLTDSIVITSTEQDLHFQQLIQTLRLMDVPYKDVYGHRSYGTVRLPTGKMSSRTGQNVLYSDFKEELVSYALDEIKKRYPQLSKTKAEKRALVIAIAAMKYSMLKQEAHKNIIFDKEETLRFEGDTGPYLLYTYARARSILRKVKTKKKAGGTINEEERTLLNELGRFGEAVHSAYEARSPHILCTYGYQLAQLFNEFYHKHQVIGASEEGFRVQLVEAFLQILSTTAYLLGLPLLEEM